MIVRAPNGTHEFIDFRETAPAAATEDMFTNNTEASITGGLASGVPGELRGLQYLHDHYGQLPWSDVLQPAIKLARYGWRVNEDLVDYMISATNGVPESNETHFLVQDPQWAMDFAPEGRLVKLNETMTRKRYADTIETIAEKGADAFYEGPIAEATIRALQAANGTMTLEDLKNYEVAIRKPSTITYRDRFRLTACSAPSGGEVALAVLKIMEGYDGVGDPANVNLTTHRLDEAMRFAYAQRSNLGDPLFLEGLDEYQEQMVSEELAEEIRGKIKDERTFNVSYYDPKGLESLETPGTSHLVAADYSGLAISLTTTVNLLFGSKLVVPETGVIMNNEMNVSGIPIFRFCVQSRLDHDVAIGRLTTYQGLLHPRRHKRLRLHPLSRKLHPPRQTPPLIHISRPDRLHHPKFFLSFPPRNKPLLHRHRRRRRFPHHHLHHPKHDPHARRQPFRHRSPCQTTLA